MGLPDRSRAVRLRAATNAQTARVVPVTRNAGTATAQQAGSASVLMTPICTGSRNPIADSTEAICLKSDSPRLYLERAGVRASLERYEETVADYDRAIGLAPDHAAAYLGRCHGTSEIGRHEEAIEDCDHAVHLDPASASASADE